MKRYEIVYEYGVITIDAAISRNGIIKAYRFLLDTGASYSVINSRVAKNLGFDLDTIAADSSHPVATASDIVFMKHITLEAFETLGHRIEGYSISVADFPDDIDGVIGNDFMEQIGWFAVRFPDTEHEGYVEVESE